MVNMVTSVRDRASVSVLEYFQALRGVAGTRVCAQRKAHPFHPRSLSSQELTHYHKTLSKVAWIPHPIRPLNRYEPLNTHKYLECVGYLVCAF